MSEIIDDIIEALSPGTLGCESKCPKTERGLRRRGGEKLTEDIYTDQTYIQTYKHTYIHTDQTYIHTYIHTYIYTYIHTYIQIKHT